MKKTFPAELGELQNVLAFADSELEKAGCSMKAQSAIDVALEEIFVNIASYAYPGENGTAEIDVTADQSEKCITIRLSDSGVEFDPLAKPDPNTALKASDRDIGGLGIFMVKKMMDDVAYEYKDHMNILTLKKCF
ncbi:MAG: ATP-binding protein [Eubacteriales bacterium]|nr:ATP-binding protein [Eubacteriales bacterium]